VQRGPSGQQTHPEVAAIPIISAEEITSPNSEPGSDREFGSSILNPVIQASTRGRPDPSGRGRARASGAAVTDISRPEPQATNAGSRKVRFSSPLASDPDEDEPDGRPIILVPNSSDPNLASRVSPDPSNHVSQSPSPPPLPSPRLLFVQSHPHSVERTLGHRTSGVDNDLEPEPGETDALVPPITVSALPNTFKNNGDIVSAGLKLDDVKGLKRREEAENVDQDQFGAGSLFRSQDPAETLLGNVQDCIGPLGVHHPHSTTILWDPDMQQGGGVRQSPAPTGPPDKVENSKPLISSFDRLTVNARRVESEGRSKLQAEVEGNEEHNDAIGTSKEVSDLSGPPPHPIPFLPLGRVLSLLDETGPSRSLGGLGRAITRKPRRPITRSRSNKLFRTQPPAEVENGWQSEGTFNVNARSGPGASKSDDLSFFAGL
jgi:hypothetical protein